MQNAAIWALGLDAGDVALGGPASGVAARFGGLAPGRGAVREPARGAPEPDVAINASPLGLAETDPLPLDPTRVPRLRAALDLVYARGGTRWVRALRAAGVRAEDGREVLVRQGAAAFARFFPDHPAPIEVMRAAVSRALGGGCGPGARRAGGGGRGAGDPPAA